MIKNIMFDLGGVILDNDFRKSVAAFAKSGVDMMSLAYQPDFWKELDEIGNYSLAQFSDKIRQASGKNDLSDEEIKQNWLALLGEIVPERLALLDHLAEKFHLYLFSNTDAIHAAGFEEKCRKQCGRELASYFTQVFYSHELGLRKPAVESFERVLTLADLQADETLFIDDKLENVESARSLGMKGYQLLTTEDLLTLDFDELTGK